MDQNEFDNCLIEKIKNNDEEAFNILANKYIPSIRFVVKCYKLLFDEEDAIQEGLILLYKCVFTFNKDRNVSFYSYYLVCLRRELVHQGNCYDARYNECLRLNEEAFVSNYDLKYSDLVYDVNNCNDLDAVQKNIFNAFYVKNMSIDFISKKYNLDKYVIYRNLHCIKEYLKSLGKMI